MTRRVPRWLARIAGLPGTTPFRRVEVLAGRANDLAAEAKSLGDGELRTRARAAAVGATAGDDDATVRYLTIAREAANRALGLRPFDVQLQACAALLGGTAVEMDTGEGKTLVGAMAAAAYALAGHPTHLLSVNDYLAERDAEWMRPLFELVGLDVAWIGQRSPRDERRAAYRADVLYAPVSEVGFDLLRDRFASTADELVSVELDTAIVDEADAVMIDEAMVPLVLAGTSAHAPDRADDAAELVADLDEGGDFETDAERSNAWLTDDGIERLESQLGGINLFEPEHAPLLTRLNLALHARVLVQRDVDYLVTHGRIELVNAARGRVAHHQRWPDGLHAAVEAKEGLEPSPRSVVLDSITVQDLVRGYQRLGGMSGTVVAVADEFTEFYDLPSGRVERNEPCRRVDELDRVFLTAAEALDDLVAEVVARHETGQPVLVGTQTVAESERLAKRLRRRNIRPRVLNAKNDADEAGIVARAGEFGSVTVSTQMSGRGTDIVLGGADAGDRDRVVEAGGLAVLATSRAPSTRLDAQLRGRAGRQGDPGMSLVITSLEANLVTENAPTHTLAEIARRGERIPEAQRRAIVRSAQSIAEGIRTDRHRSTWQYSRAIASQRRAVLAHRATVKRPSAIDKLGASLPAPLRSLGDARRDTLFDLSYRARLFFLDDEWTEHLALLGEVRDGIHLRSLASQNPVEEFSMIAHREFAGFFDRVDERFREFLDALDPDDLDRDATELGLRRPSSTWTYMVTDDPFGSVGGRFARRAGGFLRSKVLKLE
ncbi:protein translocase subunit SecA 2 [Pseudoclavibacter endophyticus]|uniref:Protein translocase subunit SecA n=1 Tax=Pseudoclavibacter endophyticus TaxID=1778590 RepID=A0A6H9WFV4_9MICO|nr:accessory Sec system translocase SecA2 [Pseudoclavibacter endophyticus]KAB1649782.1 accessory Sec system translocase SecA2 [Pseudoclavibacter endophyticus]GGA59782.1 protein translocase subunit SecA 2 [Pseudoclavibacter endophyticus]